MGTFGDFVKSQSKEVDIIKQDIAVFKNLIKERKQPLDLVRELISNAGAREVGATKIEVSYTKDKEGHIFEVSDDGCGMNFTGSQELPGRLDRFLGLGLSAIVGQKSDEFAWKGLGSKLAYQSRRVEISTRFTGHPLYEVRINEPWSTLDRNLMPKPRITEHKDVDEPQGTRVKVFGHPPHRQEEPFTFDEIRTFLMHRTFAGFTRERANPPVVVLSVLGHEESLPFGFPEFAGVQWPRGFALDEDRQALFVDIAAQDSKIGNVRLKGFLTWDADGFGLVKSRLNTGLMLSSKGIPYFSLDMEEYGARGIPHANPGVGKVCLMVESDGIHTEMNISRSDLVDSAESLSFKKHVGELMEMVESSPEYLRFRQIPKSRKTIKSGESLAKEKATIEADDQNWVIFQKEGSQPVVLVREPQNEAEVNALLWKLEALGALPFTRFQTLAYPGASSGPDLLVNFQEDNKSEAMRAAAIEIENNFYTYKPHGHHSSQYPKVICWAIPSSGRKVHLAATQKKFKFTIALDDYQVHVFVLSLMDGIYVRSRKQLRDSGIDV